MLIQTRYRLIFMISLLFLGVSLSQIVSTKQNFFTDLPKTIKNNLKDNPCKPEVKDCNLCDDKNECTRCADGKFLNIQTQPFKCDSCPTNCRGCDVTGCSSCSPGYFRIYITKFDRQSYICDKCSENCLTCANTSAQCQTCPDYYIVEKESKKCVFQYTNAIALTLVFLILIIVLMIYLCSRFITQKKEEERKKAEQPLRFASILDKDPELRKDHLVYDANTIGLNNQSMISEVQPEANEYLNMSNMSREQALTNMISSNKQYEDAYQDDIKFDQSWDEGSVPKFNTTQVHSIKSKKGWFGGGKANKGRTKAKSFFK